MIYHKMILLFLAVSFIPVIHNSPCIPKFFGHSSHVCVCNSTYCNEYIPAPASNHHILQVTSSNTGLRFAESKIKWLPEHDTNKNYVRNDDIELSIDRSKRFQKIIGFGGTFTDSSGINIASLSPGAQQNLMEAYFAPTGLEYSIARTTIGGSDFSDRPYTLCDTTADDDLRGFNLTQEDYEYKIPYIKMAQQVSKKQIKLYGSPWSAPAWMKSNKAIKGTGYLLPTYYQSWANYFIKYLDAYQKEGIEFWGLTSQNEPLMSNMPFYHFNGMGWNASNLAIFIGDYLGPTLDKAGYSGIKLMTFDDQRFFLQEWSKTFMSNPKAAKYVSGWAVHWYTDFLGFAEDLDRTHEAYPDKFILYSESCVGAMPWDLLKVELGSWYRAQLYINNIIETLNHWSVGWTDWNLALSMSGGPNWANNYADASIIVDAEKDQFYKNPMYYALGHFSKFIPEDSVRVNIDVLGGSNRFYLKVVSFERPDGAIVIVVTNTNLNDNIAVHIKDEDRLSESFIIEPKSVQTLIWH